MHQVATDEPVRALVKYRKKIKSSALIGYVSSIGLVGIVCILAFVLGQYYISGDPVIYQEYYREISTLKIDEGYAYYNIKTGGVEPIYFLLTWMASKLFEKVLFDAILNGTLVLLGLSYIIKKRVNKLLIPLFIFNFYIFVLIFSAERLKLGFIIYLWGVVLGGRVGFVLSATSVFAHLQMVIPVAMYAIAKFVRITFMQALLGIAFGASVIFVTADFLPEVFESIKEKFDFYNANVNVMVSITKVMVFAIIIFLYNRKQWLLNLVFSIIFVILSILIGSDRVIMIAYFLFLHYALRVNNGLNIGVIATSLYFTAKTALFIYSIFAFGNAFPDEEF